MARLEELEKAKYDEIEALNEQITRERESHRVAMGSAERETASLQRQLEYSQQDAIVEQDRWRARLTEAEAERHRQEEVAGLRLELLSERQAREAVETKNVILTK